MDAYDWIFHWTLSTITREQSGVRHSDLPLIKEIEKTCDAVNKYLIENKIGEETAFGINFQNMVRSCRHIHILSIIVKRRSCDI